MKVLVVGDWHSDLHEEAVSQALESLGHTIIRFGWHEYFKPTGEGFAHRLYGLWLRAQNKYIIGGCVVRLNHDLLDLVKNFRPDMVFLYRGTHVHSKTLRKMRLLAPGVILVGYNNDDPFAPGHVWGLWRHFISGLPELDLALAYRHANLDDYARAGAKRVRLLRSWYITQRNYPRALTASERKEYGCDIVFIGHYEEDSRLDCIEAVVNAGYKFRLYGPPREWESKLKNHATLSDLPQVRWIGGEEYNTALCGAKVALVFLSKLNRDTYTRRSFEIPASGVAALSEYTDDLASLFREDEEISFFCNCDDLLKKLKRLLQDDDYRNSLAQAGRYRVVHDGHDVLSRARQVMEWVVEIRDEQR